MKLTRITSLAAGTMALVLVASACSSSATPAPSAAAGAPASAAASSNTTGAASAYTPPTSAGAAAGKTIAIVSKGEQHEFWQAVKKGALDEAAKQGVTATYQGPADESKVNDQLNMLQTALSNNPAAVCFAALDSKAAGDLLNQAKSRTSRSSASTPASTARSR